MAHFAPAVRYTESGRWFAMLRLPALRGTIDRRILVNYQADPVRVGLIVDQDATINGASKSRQAKHSEPPSAFSVANGRCKVRHSRRAATVGGPGEASPPT